MSRLLWIALLAGCAGAETAGQPATKTVWDHPGMASQNFYADNSSCLAMSQGVQPDLLPDAPLSPYQQAYNESWNSMAAMDAMATKDQIYQQCMMGKGYFLTIEPAE